jgi:hypothetical protein
MNFGYPVINGASWLVRATSGTRHHYIWKVKFRGNSGGHQNYFTRIASAIFEAL